MARGGTNHYLGKWRILEIVPQHKNFVKPFYLPEEKKGEILFGFRDRVPALPN